MKVYKIKQSCVYFQNFIPTNMNCKKQIKLLLIDIYNITIKIYLKIKHFVKIRPIKSTKFSNFIIIKLQSPRKMPQIPIEPEDIILQKLQQLKCCQNCQSISNYLIFGFGLYCTQCLSQVKDVTPEQITNFSALSKIIVQLVEQYEKFTRSEVSHAKVAKTETDKATSEIVKLRKNLNFEIGSLKTRYSDLLNDRYKKCLKEHTLEQLEALYEPDMTATIIMNETDLLIKNLEILKIRQNENKEIEHKFMDESKHPKEVYQKCSKEYDKVKKVLLSATEKVKAIIDQWKIQIKNQ